MVAPVKAAYRIAVLSTLLSACASVPPQQQRLVVALPPPVSVPVLQAPTPVPAEPASTAAATAPAVVVATPLPPAAPPQAPKSGLSDAEGRALLAATQLGTLSGLTATAASGSNGHQSHM